ncbi:hypothetical protein CC80DRAFT_188141 [Byssothecium circinans]|uniref:Uncharacterized protein n=1 Tax=Byssothecium circinans TaxID=147558 RepID=A0A6A5TI71_9PLEO|nr:hypothetical protein CC80DRAFT_188141 [Byssothecium circinans]
MLITNHGELRLRFWVCDTRTNRKSIKKQTTFVSLQLLGLAAWIGEVIQATRSLYFGYIFHSFDYGMNGLPFLA